MQITEKNGGKLQWKSDAIETDAIEMKLYKQKWNILQNAKIVKKPFRHKEKESEHVRAVV